MFREQFEGPNVPVVLEGGLTPRATVLGAGNGGRHSLGAAYVAPKLTLADLTCDALASRFAEREVHTAGYSMTFGQYVA